MQNKKVIVIEPKSHRPSRGSHGSKIRLKKRVCAYARVSTDFEDQLNSYKAQINEYTKKINDNEEWIFQGMYADEGISGTSIKKRPQFMQMIQDAKEGKIDLILTKSISRFARNTIDCISTVRELRSLGVEVYFEKENIASSDTKIDFMLSVFSSIAQEESRNISENIKWGYQQRFKEGIVHVNTKTFLGFDKDKNGKIIINQEEAKTVRTIYDMYLAGSSQREIVDFLIKNNFKNGRGDVKWTVASIQSILTNEKYCGDAILQKNVTIDYLTHKSVKNNGIAPKYHIMNNHEPIVTREAFELVQELKKKRGKKKTSSTFGNHYPLSGIVYCGCCGRVMHRHYFNYNKPNQRVVLSCKNTIKEKIECTNKPIDNTHLELAAKKSIKELNMEDASLIDETLALLQSNFSMKHLHEDIMKAQAKIAGIEDEIRALIEMNVANITDGNADFYKEIYQRKKELLLQEKASLETMQNQFAETHLEQDRLMQIKEFLENEMPLNKTILTTAYKAIIALSQNEVIFIISPQKITKKYIETNLSSLKITEHLYDGQVYSKTRQSYINYKVIEIEGQANAS